MVCSPHFNNTAFIPYRVLKCHTVSFTTYQAQYQMLPFPHYWQTAIPNLRLMQQYFTCSDVLIQLITSNIQQTEESVTLSHIFTNKGQNKCKNRLYKQFNQKHLLPKSRIVDTYSTQQLCEEYKIKVCKDSMMRIHTVMSIFTKLHYLLPFSLPLSKLITFQYFQRYFRSSIYAFSRNKCMLLTDVVQTTLCLFQFMQEGIELRQRHLQINILCTPTTSIQYKFQVQVSGAHFFFIAAGCSYCKQTIKILYS